MAKRSRTSQVRTQLSRVTSSYAPGYRDLTLILKDSIGNEYELRLPPDKVQSLIYDIVDVVKQIGAPHPPIDWKQYPLQIAFPSVTPWMPGPKTTPSAERGGPTVADPNRPYCKPDQSCCDFCCGN